MKRWFQSKTMVINLLTLVVGLLATVQGADWIMSNPVASAVVLAAVGGVNMVLRFVTYKGIQ